MQVVAAALVGFSLLWLVFEPMFTAAGARPADAIDMDALEDLEDTRSGVALARYRYDPPFTFTGTLDRLTITLVPEPAATP